MAKESTEICTINLTLAYTEADRQLQQKEGLAMKVVVVKSPAVFRGVLRLLFGMKKEKAE